MKFYLSIIFELLLFPLFYLWEEFRNLISSKNIKQYIYPIAESEIEPINDVIYLIHEWGKYQIKRKKRINIIPEFECGLLYQIQRLDRYKGVKKIQKYLTISDYSNEYLKCLENNGIMLKDYNVIPVQNKGMDFAGYSYLTKNIIDSTQNQIVFLTNTSIEKGISDYIDEYISFFEKYPNLGLLGISYSTRISQSLIKNKFSPHLQSFFLVSRSQVLKQVVELNNGKFPGEKETLKYSIIRFGEIKLSNLISKLGYDLAVIEPDGNINFLPKDKILNNGYNAWKLPYGDRRLTNNSPNRIYSILNSSHK